MDKVTLQNLGEKSAQEVFDFIAGHLLRQGQRSMSGSAGGNVCVYRNPDGLSCAAGILLTDEEASKLEGNNWHQLVEGGMVPRFHCLLISELQGVHDTCIESTWIVNLSKVAARYGLSDKVLRENNNEGSR